MHSSMRTKAMMWIATGTLLGLGCPADEPEPPAADSTGADSTGTDETTGSNVSMTSGNDGADTTAGPSESSGIADGSFLDPSTDDEGPGPTPQPNGSSCDGDDGCTSGHCYTVPMVGGICSECINDDDCPTGTCSLDLSAGYAICTDGSLGVMCSTDEGCMGELVCTQLIDTGGLFPADFCSECRDDDVPCADDLVCSPVYDLQNFAGYHGCVEPGTVENDGGCPLDGVMGDGTVCASGFCGVANAFGLIPVGVCGECLSDMDCVAMGLTTCEPAVADQMGLLGASCI